jgi:hypothetical protein
MRPADVAVLKGESQHHVIITEIDYSSGTMRTVEGNRPRQYIEEVNSRKIAEVAWHYRIIY